MIAEAKQENELELNWQFSNRQAQARETLTDPEVLELCYGGAKGGGKSVLGVRWAYLFGCEVIERFQLGAKKYPPVIGFMGRKQGTDFNDTTLESWKREIPEACYQLRVQDKEIVLHDRVKIAYGGMDDREVVNKFNSAEFGFVFIDQAEELTLDDVGMLRGTLRLAIGGVHVPTKCLWTANPAQCWIKTEFLINPTPAKRFIRSLPSDNPFLPAGYIEQLKDAWKHRPEILRAYLYGDWDSMAAANQMIRDEWIQGALDRVIHAAGERVFLVCDPARFGDDETVIYCMINTDIESEEIYGQKDTMYTANRLHTLAIQKEATTIVVDEVGIGAGIVDRLREMSGGAYEVLGINGASKPTDDVHYYNLRAEIYDTAAQMLQEGDVDLSWNDEVLRSQLCTPTYLFRGSKMLVEPKEDIKKRLLRSPDRGDCYTMGLYVSNTVRDKNKRTKRNWKDEYRRNDSATTAMSA